MRQIIKYIVIASLTIFTGLFFIDGYQKVKETYVMAAKEYFLVVIPVAATYLLFLRRRLDFFENLTHEFTHMLFSMLTFKKVSGLYVSATSGIIYTEGSQKSILVALSPYFFPLITITLVVLFTLINVEYSYQIIVASYALFAIVTIKHLIKNHHEVGDIGLPGWLILFILNFWISYFILSWCSSHSFNLNEILITVNDGFKRIVSQFKLS
jgi:hypothetical protein